MATLSRSVLSRFLLTATAATIGAAALTRAQTSITPLNIRAGLWEVTATAQTSGMPDMPPGLSDSQKAQLGAMMQKVQPRQQAPSTERMCVTDDPTKPIFQPPDQKGTTCTRTVVSGTANAQDSTMKCKGDAAATGNTHVDRDSDETAHGQGRMVMGEQMTMTYVFTAKWIGEKCAVK